MQRRRLEKEDRRGESNLKEMLHFLKMKILKSLWNAVYLCSDSQSLSQGLNCLKCLRTVTTHTMGSTMIKESAVLQYLPARSAPCCNYYICSLFIICCMCCGKSPTLSNKKTTEHEQRVIFNVHKWLENWILLILHFQLSQKWFNLPYI